MNEDGPPCHCGSRGCLNAVAGTSALLATARAAGLPAEEITALIELAQRGEETSVAIIREAGVHLGIAVASLVNLINPGGGR